MTPAGRGAEVASADNPDSVPLSRILQAAAASVAGLLTGARLPEGIETAAARFGLAGPNRAALQDIAYDCTRRLAWAQAVAAQLNARRPAPEWLALQLVALAQLESALALPASRPTARRHPAVIVDEAVTAAAPTHSAFMNATLRRFLRERPALIAHASATTPSVQANLPAWWLDRLQADWPLVWPQVVAAQQQPAPLMLRVNRRRADRAGLLAQYRAEGLRAWACGEDGIALAASRNVTTLAGFAQGWISVQDAGAQRAAGLLDARAGQRVLDACAAPGGKTAHLLEGCDGLDLTALDSDRRRLARVGENLDRLGLRARVQHGDAAVSADWWDGRPYDRILLDAPCTASGIVRRHPDIPWLRKRGDIATLVDQQWRLLNALWPLLQRGGKLLYSTCSVFSAEGQQVIAGFVKRTPDAALLTINRDWAHGMTAHTSRGQPGEVCVLLPTRAPDADWPAELPVNDHDGFCYALLERRSAS